jgi:symplekin
MENVQWTEETIKTCLYLYLDLMPTNHALIHPFSQIYISSISEVKRVILKMLEAPIKSMGINSQELLKLIQDFPTGAETLVLRIIHILTEKTAPTSELVEKVRNLYDKRLPDVRFLIPVLTGLSKKEITSALPQLIKLSQAVVKEVFNRLLGINVNVAIHKSPLSPTELLVALHQIDQSSCDLKTIIGATSLCFAEKQIYTQEILASVMQQLIDVTPIPTLYMRSVIQSVTIYPKLSGFVIIMMQRLIGKQIWKYPKVWEGFIKCCQRIKPISQQVLFQLPHAQLKEVFSSAPDLKEHCKLFLTQNPQQRLQISEQLLQLVD